MVSLKNGVLKVTSEDRNVAKLIYDFCFVINMVAFFAFYQVKFVAPAAALLLLAASIFIWTGRKKSRVVIPYNTVWYTVFIIYAGLSVLWSSYISTDFINGLFKMAVVLAIITAVSIYIDMPEDLERIISLFIFSMVIISVLELSATSASLLFDGKWGSHFSKCNPNEIAFWSACAGIMSFYKFYIKKQKGYIVLAVLFLVLVLMSGSRKALIEALITPFVIIVLSTYKKNYITKVFLMMAVIGFVVYFVMTNEYAYKVIGVRLSSLARFFETGTQRADNSMYKRQFYIEIAKKMFSESPLFGKGMGNFEKILDYDLGKAANYSHNNHWQILSELGIVGYVIYYSFYVFCIVKLIKEMVVRKSRTSILFLPLILMIFVIERGMVTYYVKTTQLVLAIIYAATYVGGDDGRRFGYLKNSENLTEE